MDNNSEPAYKKISWASPSFGGNEREYLLDALDSTWISGGPYVNKLEETFARIMGREHAIAVSNGTTALQLGLLALGIGPGDEVIVPGFAFVAAGNTVIHCGATPVFADVDPDTWCLDPRCARKAITSATKVILPVHTYGNICAMDEICALADECGLAVIEDTAEAAFSKWGDSYAGSIGDVGCYSFHATKTITTGEGGMVTTDNQALADKMRLLRDHGMRKGTKYWHDCVGYNFRMTNLQAAIGCAQLERLDTVLEARAGLYEHYYERLSRIKGARLQRFYDKVQPAVWALGVILDRELIHVERDEVMQRLEDFGIEVRPGFYPFSVMPAYKSTSQPVAEDVSSRIICLPFHPSLSAEDVDYICDRLTEVIRG